MCGVCIKFMSVEKDINLNWIVHQYYNKKNYQSKVRKLKEQINDWPIPTPTMEECYYNQN